MDERDAKILKKEVHPEATDPNKSSEAYDLIDRFLRNNLGDVDYDEYSKALDKVWLYPHD